ncbi:MAG: substrate-binding domain-containing protein [Peptococcaceae bacterium]|nr:substrate-binding domain-containing protein [Peptococcaceae bacterium]MBQ2003908.1 substrate-binding domain-containing protein [Peptococcaceae bacterium]MBQ2020841.1 substrate-binding domain-containing protein [Peptococcaceae bacterium]MBQ2368783.1 substrate-binding domain-containing protein [Peptococcaceae bacterium]MBQ2432240.1 substrate-binding domain-containing protein [Peptococcaceae bacterium]
MLVFSGCTTKQQSHQIDVPKKVSLQLSLDEYPRMDGSTANLPMMAEIMSRVCDITLEEAEELTSCTKTSNAWSNIANGNADILLVYEAAEDTKAYLDTVGTELEITPLGRDALVFINNEQNPVENLTQQQLIDIYTGNVTNWNEVGGEDLEIIPYQRVATSGSQSLFMKLLMKDIVPMDAPMELRPAEMGMLIDELARYNNEGNALGYSVFYYASYMYQQPGLKMIAVDGVQPSDETIADGSYPLLNEYYLVIRADEPEDSPARQLRNWILTDEGRAAIIEAGYIPMPKE